MVLGAVGARGVGTQATKASWRKSPLGAAGRKSGENVFQDASGLCSDRGHRRQGAVVSQESVRSFQAETLGC